MALVSTDFQTLFDTDETWGLGTMNNNVGVKQWNPHNLLKSSEDFSDSNWTKTDTTVTSNAAAAPDGTITADKISHDDTTADIYQDTTVISGQEYVSALCAKYIDHQWMRISVDGGYDCWFDIQNGVVGTETGVTGTITALADGWYYLTVTLVAPDTNRTFYVTLADSDGGFAETSGTEAYIWGAHLYRNDLGGMAKVPESDRALAALEYYVPNTTSAARYLPRRENHEYINGSWIEGMLVEPDGATNLVTNNSLDGAVVGVVGSGGSLPTGWSSSFGSVEVLEISTYQGQPSIRIKGTTDNTGGGSSAYPGLTLNNWTAASSTAYCYSITTMDGPDISGLSQAVIQASDGVSNFLSTQIDGNSGMTFNYKSATSDPSATSGQIKIATTIPAATLGVFDMWLVSPQLEAGLVPTSYIPTSGSAVSRGAETTTIPASVMDSLGLFNTVAVDGTELVTNGGFDTDTDWTKGTGWTIGSGVASVANSGSASYLTPDSYPAPTVGGVYEVTYTVSNYSAGNTIITLGGNNLASRTANGTYTQIVTAQTTAGLAVYGGTTANMDIDNISVKEIHRRAIGIQMHGYMSYGDDGTNLAASIYNWAESIDNLIRGQIRLDGADVGTFRSWQSVNGTGDTAEITDAYSPGINVPFKIASRHLDNAVQGAADGTATTENTTPPGLPDLSGVDLEVAYSGPALHITKFNIFAENQPASDGNFKMDETFVEAAST